MLMNKVYILDRDRKSSYISLGLGVKFPKVFSSLDEVYNFIISFYFKMKQHQSFIPDNFSLWVMEMMFKVDVVEVDGDIIEVVETSELNNEIIKRQDLAAKLNLNGDSIGEVSKRSM